MLGIGIEVDDDGERSYAGTSLHGATTASELMARAHFHSVIFVVKEFRLQTLEFKVEPEVKVHVTCWILAWHRRHMILC